jgi:hypothetical protein
MHSEEIINVLFVFNGINELPAVGCPLRLSAYRNDRVVNKLSARSSYVCPVAGRTKTIICTRQDGEKLKG